MKTDRKPFETCLSESIKCIASWLDQNAEQIANSPKCKTRLLIKIDYTLEPDDINPIISINTEHINIDAELALRGINDL